MNDQLEANKSIVREWHDLAINQCKPEEAVAKYLGPRYRQHNPGAGAGPEPFIQAVVNRNSHNVATSNPSYN